jgi:hypothetical protein
MTANIFRSLGGKRTGKNSWLVKCPCPGHGKGHGDKNPSLSVSIGANGKPLFYCFAGCTYDEVTDALKARGLTLDESQPFNGNRPRWKKPVIIEQEEPNPEPDPDALELWQASLPGSDDRSEVLRDYFECRGLLTVPPSVRYLPETSHMIAGVQRPSDGKLITVQMTPISATARRGERRTFPKAKLGAGAVRLQPAAEIMGIAEGVETALSAQQIFRMPVWASLGSSRLDKVELPPEVREVHIFGDNDRPGRNAADKAAELHHRLGRKATMHFPEGDLNDFNDVLCADADVDYLPEGDAS